MRSFKAHDVDGIGSNPDEDEPHCIEIKRPPVVFQEHVRVPSDEDH